jgi:acyl-CoA synthetase (AMP-forming)/AMP-acid ligase II
VIPHRFSATNFWSYVKKYKVTWYTAVPTIHQILLMRGTSNHAAISFSFMSCISLSFFCYVLFR